MGSSSETDQTNVSLRRFPYPYQCAFTIANDADGLDWHTYLGVYSIFHQELNLPFSTSFFLFPNPKANYFAYFKDQECADGPERSHIESLIKAGYLDTIHGFGEFEAERPFKREYAEKAYGLLTERDLFLRYFSSHGNSDNIQQVNSDLQYQYAQGDLPTSPAYHLDLTVKYGIRHLWHWTESGLTNVIGQDTAGVLDENDQTIIFCVNENGGRVSGVVNAEAAKQELQARNILQQPVKMKDDQIVYNFQRFNGGGFKCVASNISRQINPDVINDLIKTKGYMVLYQHLACALDSNQKVTQNVPPYFSAESLEHFRNLSSLFQNGVVWVAPFADMARYNDVHTHLDWKYRLEDTKVIIEIKGFYPDAGGRRIEVSERDVAGITFYTPYPDETTIQLDGRTLNNCIVNGPDVDGASSISIPLRSHDYALVSEIKGAQEPSIPVSSPKPSSPEPKISTRSETSPKKNIHIHIGINKTASSLFQRVLMGINQDVLAPNNYFYDSRVSDPIGRQLRDMAPLSDSQMSEYYNFFKKMHDEVPQNNIIIASNTFAGKINDAFRDVPYIVNMLKAFFIDFNVKIYAFVRRQDEFIESSYVQAIKIGSVQTFGEFFQERSLAYACDWHHLFQIYGETFGLENITVLPYEFFIAEPQAFYDTIFTKLGIPVKIDVSKLPRVNPGVNQKAIEIQKLSNPHLDDQEKRMLRTFLEQAFPKVQSTGFQLFSPETRQDLLNHYSASNQELFAKFMPDLSRYSY
jgi:hypothetical protein